MVWINCHFRRKSRGRRLNHRALSLQQLQNFTLQIGAVVVRVPFVHALRINMVVFTCSFGRQHHSLS
ncbi:MAG: hypothetical protein ACK55Z_26820, partial [bacterium]